MMALVGAGSRKGVAGEMLIIPDQTPGLVLVKKVGNECCDCDCGAADDAGCRVLKYHTRSC